MKLRDLSESPLADYSYVGSDEPDNLTASTIALAKSPKAKAKAIRMFKNTPYVFRVVFLNQSQTKSHDSNIVGRLNDRGEKYKGHLQGDITGYTKHPEGDVKFPEYLLPYAMIYRKTFYQNLTPYDRDFSTFLKALKKNNLIDLREPRQQYQAFRDGELFAAGHPAELKQRYPDAEIRQRFTPTQLKAQERRYLKNKAEYDKLYEIYNELREYHTQIINLEPLSQPPIHPETQAREGEIVFVINSNHGDDFVPFTPWMIAHRFGHALALSNGPLIPVINSILIMIREQTRIATIKDDDIPISTGATFNGVLAQIGKFKSARDKTFGNEGEFILDCFAQYLIQGSVTFNPVQSPIQPIDDFRTRRSTKSNNEYVPVEIDADFLNRRIQGWFISEINQKFEEALDGCVGRVFSI